MQASLSRLAAAAPRYQHVAAALQAAVAEGRYPVGSLLPPEPQLCEAFGVSRHTLREAVRILCDLGLLSRHQGVGTRVQAARANERYVATLGSLADLMQYTQETRLEARQCRSIEVAPPLSGWLECLPGDDWLEMEVCRYPRASEVPIVDMRVYVRPDLENVWRDLQRGSGWIHGLVEQHGGETIVEVRQTVGAVALPKDSARLLQVKPGSPGLRVRRQYRGEARLISMSVNLYPVDRFEFVTTWRLEDRTGN
jgi:GntR family transcriptional regulator